MDRERRLYWGRYLRVLADKMELRDWTIGTMHRPADDGKAASCVCTYGQKKINVFLGLRFDDDSPEEQRVTLVHELLHAHLAGAHRLLIDAQANVRKTWIDQLECAVRVQHEYAVDAIADIVAKYLPLPPTEETPKRKRKKKGKRHARTATSERQEDAEGDGEGRPQVDAQAESARHAHDG